MKVEYISLRYLLDSVSDKAAIGYCSFSPKLLLVRSSHMNLNVNKGSTILHGKILRNDYLPHRAIEVRHES